MNKSQYFGYLYSELAVRQINRVSVSVSIAIIFISLALAGNLTVCYAVLKTKGLRSLPNFFPVILAMADAGTAVIVMPLWIDVLITGKMNFTQDGCKFTGFITSFLSTGKLLTIHIIIINRAFKIFKPQTYSWLFQKWVAVGMVTATWALALTVTIIFTTSGLTEIEFHPGRAICLLVFKDLEVLRAYHVTQFLFSVVVPLTINIPCHVKAYQELKEHKREVRGKIRVQNFNKSKEDSEIKTMRDHAIQATRTLLALVYGYALCSFLTGSMRMADSSRPYFLDRGTHVALTFFSFVDSIVSPALFSRTSRPFRNVCLEMFGCKWRRKVIDVQ